MTPCNLRQFIVDIDAACPLGLGSTASPECAAAIVRASHQNSARCIVTPLFEHSPPIANYLCRGDALKTPGVRSLCSEVKWSMHTAGGQTPGRPPSPATTAQGGHKGAIATGIDLGALSLGALGFGAGKIKASHSGPTLDINPESGIGTSEDTQPPLDFVTSPPEITDVADLINAHAKAHFDDSASSVDYFDQQVVIERSLYDELVTKRMDEMRSLVRGQDNIAPRVELVNKIQRNQLELSIAEGQTRTSW